MSAATDPLRWKLGVAAGGLQLDSSAGVLAAGRPPDTIDLVLPDGMQVAAPLDGADSATPYRLAAESGRYFLSDLRRADVRLEVRPGRTPRFANERTGRGIPMQSLATVHGTHLVVHPGGACGFSAAGAPCRFCTEGARGTAHGDVTPADVVEVVRAAFDEGAAELVLFNSSVFDADDGGIAHLTPLIEAVRKHFDTLVVVQTHPPRDLRWIDRTYAMGVDAISYNLEVFDAEQLGRHCVGRARYIGRDRYLEALAHAATVFPRGTVWTELVAGLDDPQTLVTAVDTLVEADVQPVIVVRRTPATRRLDPEALTPVLQHLFRRVRERGIPTSWLRDLTLGVTPLEARFAAGEDARLSVAVQSFTRSGLGALAARGLARLRRRLRVRSVSESFDSAHL
ncbi:MAG: hypothetical protein KIT14_23875 [bacterium]|nr:hypothetical protein [bacterium]